MVKKNKDNNVNFNGKLADWKRNYQEHAALKNILIVGFFVIAIGFLLIRALMATHTSQVADTRYNDYQDLSDSYSIAMTYKAYNPKKDFMEIALNVKGQDDTTISYPKVKIQTKLLSPQSGVKTKIIRAGDSSYVVVIKNLKKGYGAVLLKVKTVGNQSLSEDNNIDTTIGEVPEQIQSSDTSSNKEDGSAKIYINEISKINDPKLKLKTDKDYWLETVKREMKIINKNKDQLNRQVTTLQEKIDNDNASITKAKRSMEYQTTAEKKNTNEQISETRSEIKSNESNIKQLKKVLRERNQKVKLLNKESDDIRNGKYKLD